MEKINKEYDKLQNKYGSKELNSVYGYGKKDGSRAALVFMNPTKRNIATEKSNIFDKKVILYCILKKYYWLLYVKYIKLLVWTFDKNTKSWYYVNIQTFKEGDMMATVQTLNKIRESLERHLGKKILLKANKGRKQIVTKKGILEKVYPSVSVVRLDDGANGYSRVSYTATARLKGSSAAHLPS